MEERVDVRPGVLIWANGNRYEGQWENGVPKGNGVFSLLDGSSHTSEWNKELKIQQYNGSFDSLDAKEKIQSNGVVDSENLTATFRKRSSVDAARGSLTERNFPRICIWESDGEAGDITCDILDNVEASMLYREGFKQFKRTPCCLTNDAKKPGQTISKGHKNYELMLNLQQGIR